MRFRAAPLPSRRSARRGFAHRAVASGWRPHDSAEVARKNFDHLKGTVPADFHRPSYGKTPASPTQTLNGSPAANLPNRKTPNSHRPTKALLQMGLAGGIPSTNCGSLRLSLISSAAIVRSQYWSELTEILSPSQNSRWGESALNILLKKPRPRSCIAISSSCCPHPDTIRFSLWPR
jgi:hypothetical protein